MEKTTDKITEIKYGKEHGTRLDRDMKEDFTSVEFQFYRIDKRDENDKITETTDLLKKVYGLEQLSMNMQAQLACHGLLAKLGDSLASMKDVSISDCGEQLDKLWGQLVKGEWSSKKAKSERVTKVTAEKLAETKLPEGMTQEMALELMKQLGLFKG